MNLKFYFHHYNYNMNQKPQSMFVIKRNGEKENVLFDKITNRIKKLMYDIEDIEPAIITQKLCTRIIPGITTTELDNLASQICMSMLTDNPNYAILGARIAISNHQKNTDNNFLEVLTKLRNNKDIHNEPSPLINEDLISLATKYEKEINDMINHERDYLIDFFGFKTLEKSYLLKINKKSIERPQHLFMRVALAIHRDDLVNVKKTYDNLSLKNYTHATPTLFNAGCPSQQLSSCYLIATEDSVEGIFETMTDCAKISKWSGGIGLHISNIRANGSYIRKTAGYSDGIMPMLKVYNDIARYINQCFTPETIVYTTSGPKEISNILEGDEVITIDGTPKRVLGIKKTNIKKDILKIKSTYSADSVNVTDEHQIYVLRGQRKMLRHNVIINRLEKKIIKEEYISAKDMNTNDILCYPIPVITEYFKIDKDICRFYGIMLGDGHISKKKNSNSKEAGITMGFAKIETINFVKKLLEKYKIYYWEDIKETNCVRIGWTHTNLENTLGFCYDDLYDSNHHKRVAKRFLNMNNENTLSLIRGLIETDGSIGNEIYFSSTSKNLIESLRYCLLRLGILSSGYIKNNIGNVSTYKNITTRLLSYNLRIPKDTLLCEELKIEPSKKLGYFRYKNTLYSKIKSISNFEYEGEVFDLNIEDNHNYLTQMGLVHNSGKRNGSFAVYTEPWHADIFTFLDAKKNHGSEELRARDLFYALWVPDLFMKAIEEGGDWYLMCPDKCPGLPDVYGEEFDKLYFKYVVENKYNKKIKARELWDAIISSQIETGVPYMLYKDAANKKSNQKNIDTIKSSNLCVAGDTMILTKEGYYPIEELKNKDVEVWNGKEWSKTIVKKTGSNQKLINIKFSNGMNLKCTEYHKFYIETSSRPANKSVPIVVEAKNLEKNMRIIRYDFEQTTDNNNELKYAYTHGLYCADGTKSTNKSQHRCHYKRQEGKYFCGRHLSHIKDYDIEDGICCANSYSDKPMLPLYGEKIKLLGHIDKISHGEYIEKQNKINVSLPYDIKEKYYVPINNSINSKIRWLEGYFDGDSCIIENDGLKNIQYSSINLKFMRDILLLLQTLGISSQIKVSKKEKKTLLPDGKGGNKYYNTKISYRSSIDSNGLNKLIELGFNPKRLNIENTRLPHHVTNMFTKVENIVDENEYGDTFCFNEPLEHKGIFNGIITGQCAEIIEVSNSDETAVCLTSDTIIITEEGPKLITECDNLNVLSFYNNDEDLVKDQQYIKAKLINNGVKEVFEIDLVGGFPIKATKNHKFLVLKNRNYNTKNNVYEWKSVEELTLKDRINRPKIDPLPIYKDVDIKTQNDVESLVVGWMIGDGWQRSYETGNYYTYGVCFGSTEIYAQKIVIDYLNIIQNSLGAQKNGHNKPIKGYTSKNGVVQWASSKKSFAEYFIEKYGLEPKLGIHKNLSDKIKKLKPNKIASILSGLFSADGTVYKTETTFYVGLSSSSKELLIDTQVLLKCFGITSGLVFTEVKSRNRFQGKLTIQNRDSIKLFSKYINFLLCPEKKNKLEDGILNHKYLRDVDEKEWMSIRNIKSVGFENVYDLNIPNTHNFIANMVTTHNCNLASICLPSILEYPNKSYHDWYDLLTHEEKQLSEYYFRGRLKLLSEPDCVYCKLLKALLKEVGLEYEEISNEKAEELRQFCARPIPDKFTTIPQLFSIIENGEIDEVKHLGGYTKTWNLLSPKINHNRLRDLSYDLTKNLNKIIDINYYPTEKTKVSNMRHRPIGIGVQGLADLFLALKLPFDSVEARKINKEIFETIYFGALDSSHTLAFKEGPYSTFDGSPLSEGILQFNMWGLKDEDLSGRWKWNSLRKNIMRDGVRNSLLVALMPTASTSQIMGSFVECFEPLTSNLYTRRTLAGEFVIINPYLVKDLINLDMWNDDIKNRLQYDKGSVKNIKNFPFKDIYRTVWEIPQKSLIEMSADRGAFVCQSQSLNLFFEKPEYKKLSMAHLLGWKLGLKTGSYYIRSKPATNAQRFAMDADVERKLKEEDLQNKEETECLSCGA